MMPDPSNPHRIPDPPTPDVDPGYAEAAEELRSFLQDAQNALDEAAAIVRDNGLQSDVREVLSVHDAVSDLFAIVTWLEEKDGDDA